MNPRTSIKSITVHSVHTMNSKLHLNEMMRDYVAIIETLAHAVRAWLDSNPTASPLIQWNFPSNVLVSVPLSVAMHSHYVTANADGINLLNTLRGKDANTDPTLFMCRMAIEHVAELAPPSKGFDTRVACPHCGYEMQRSMPVNGMRPPKAGDYTICIDCTALSQFDTQGALIKSDETTAPAEIQNLLTRARSYIRDNPPKRF
jgi:hypothetical protein